MVEAVVNLMKISEAFPHPLLLNLHCFVTSSSDLPPMHILGPDEGLSVYLYELKWVEWLQSG